ncbi:signal peptidase I [Hespellia stercorisuis]|uniref:Signal peptidase I n=1 Tax=Hespellia stercorisuis DSM 15480 TaxID=1121950 RepID=A0A1M6W076_9FIRM|nr:signal peptidase I [Hespellia stercorisuis]SHK87008.1 signal peptidase I [Hespellia stercorisuis DSM 15480]
MGQEVRQQEREPPSLLQEILFLFLKIGAILILLVLLFTFLFGIFRNGDNSMAPGFREGDLVVYYRLDKAYIASDNLVVEYEGKKQVRRVVAVAGDTVDITEEGLLINGSLQDEPRIYEETKRYAQGIDFPVTIKEGEVFLLGDSREQATDSRIYGPVQVKDTLGKVMTLIRRRDM